MKVSIEDFSSADDEKRELVYHAEVYLDGQKVERCTMADEEGGEVEFYIPQDDPRWQTEFKHIDYWPTEKKQGKVEIVDRRKSDG